MKKLKSIELEGKDNGLLSEMEMLQVHGGNTELIDGNLICFTHCLAKCSDKCSGSGSGGSGSPCLCSEIHGSSSCTTGCNCPSTCMCHNTPSSGN